MVILIYVLATFGLYMLYVSYLKNVKPTTKQGKILLHSLKNDIWNECTTEFVDSEKGVRLCVGHTVLGLRIVDGPGKGVHLTLSDKFAIWSEYKKLMRLHGIREKEKAFEDLRKAHEFKEKKEDQS